MNNTKVGIDIAAGDERGKCNLEGHTDGFEDTNCVLFLNKGSILSVFKVYVQT